MNKEFDLEHTSITLEALFDTMPVAMALIDREGREVAVNQEWRMIYSLNNSDVKGRKVTDFC